MAVEPVKLRLSVWRDFSPNRALLLRDDGASEHLLLSAESNLQQEVYVWQTREDAFGGIADDEARQRLRQLLVERFAATKPPSERRFSHVQDFIDEAGKLVESNGAEWTISQEASDEDEQPIRLNTLLALRNHLEWLRHTFAEQPGVSVLVR